MKLVPYASIAERRRKVLKHVFDHRQRWWEVIYDGDLLAWHAPYTALRGVGCLAEGWQRALDHPAALAIIDEHHEHWLTAATQACEQALAEGRVYPDGDRLCFIGELGVTVYVAPLDDGDGDDPDGESSRTALVTCFRPACATWSRLDADEATIAADRRARTRSGYFARASVRRRARRTSLSVSNDADSEGSPE